MLLSKRLGIRGCGGHLRRCSRPGVVCTASKARKVNYVRAPFVRESPTSPTPFNPSPMGNIVSSNDSFQRQVSVSSPPRQRPARASSAPRMRPGLAEQQQQSEDMDLITPRMATYTQQQAQPANVPNKDEGDMLTAEIRRGLASPAIILRSYKKVKQRFQKLFGTSVPQQVFRGLAVCNYSTDHLDSILLWLAKTYTPPVALRLLKRAHHLLSLQYPDMQQRVQHLSTMLGSAKAAREAILKEPRLLTLDPPTISSRCAQLQALLDEIHATCNMVARCTALDVALKNPRILTVFPETLAAKWEGLRPLLHLQPSWRREFERFGAYLLGEALLKGNETYARLVFLAELHSAPPLVPGALGQGGVLRGGRGGGRGGRGGVRATAAAAVPAAKEAGLRAALIELSQSQFMQRYPAYHGWLMQKVDEEVAMGLQ